MVRRGYDPEAVRRHLDEVADFVAELRHRAASTPVAEATSEKVRSIVEAAEQSAAEIEREAELTFRRIEQDKQRGADRFRAEAEQRARDYVEGAKASIEELAGMAEGLRDVLAGELERGLREAVEDLRAIESRIAVASEALLPASPPRAPVLPAHEAEDEPEVPQDEPEVPQDEPEVPQDQPEVPQDEPEVPQDEPEVPQDEPSTSPAEDLSEAGSDVDEDADASGARLVALNMALNGAPREETDRYLEENFRLRDRGALLDDVYARVG